MSTHDERMRALIDDHFEGRIQPEGEREMREHLEGCASCREYYERRQLLASVDPGAAPPRIRLARGLGLEHERPPLRLLSPLPALAAVAAAAVALLVLWPMLSGGEKEFASRGNEPPSVPALLLVYQVPRGGELRLADTSIGANDELAFAYENRDGKRRLLVFGVDDSGRIYWYHPAWTDAGSNPQAVAIEAGPERRELPEAVSHRLEGQTLRLFGVFTDEPLTVRDVERMLKERERKTDPLPIRNAVQHSQLLRITR